MYSVRKNSNQYFNLIIELSRCWFKKKDQRSIMGFLWSFLNPLLMSGILYLTFKRMMGVEDGLDYFFYILSGAVLWNFFIMSTSAATQSLIIRAQMIRNVSFSKEIVVFATIGVFLIQFLFEIFVLLVLIIVFTNQLSFHILFFPLIFLLEILIAVGFSLYLSSICVFIRDLYHIWNVFTRMGFFIVPIFYKISDIGGPLSYVITYNPITQILIMARKVLLYNTMPDPLNYFFVLAFALIFCLSGFIFFKKIEYRISERI